MNVSSRFDVAGFGVIVTGGASGLGLAYGEVLAAHGARVTLIDVDGEAVEAEASRLRGEGLDVRGTVADVTDHPALDRAIDEAAQAYGRLDVAFANAGIDPGVGFVGAWAGGQRPRVEEGALERYTDERWNRVIEINLNGIFATARAAARHMRPRRFGRIIITTSLAATMTEGAIGSAYMAAKAGARHFMHWSRSNSPPTASPSTRSRRASSSRTSAAATRTTPTCRRRSPRTSRCIASASRTTSRRWPCSSPHPACEYITGQEIVIDGGWGLGVAD